MGTEQLTPVVPAQTDMAEKQRMIKIIIAIVVVALLIAAIIFFVNSRSSEVNSSKNVESQLSAEENSLIADGTEVISEEEEIDLGEII